jgi:F-type H+-transporting ATPase subunit a
VSATTAAEPKPDEKPKDEKDGFLSRLSTKQRVFLGLGLWVLLIGGLALVLGSAGKNDAYKPQNEFKLDTWINLPGPFDINKGVFYVFLATGLTIWAMLYISKRMQQRPNRVQTLIELAYGLMRDNITRGNMEDKMAKKWFPFIATLFLFIWFSNMIGYLPLPTNTEEKINIFGAHIPAFALYAATANLSIPLVLALVVWIAYNIEGVRTHGVIGYLRKLVPPGVPGWLKGPIFVLELISNFMRLISLSVRLFANILAGHLIILFMSGALVVLLGVVAVGAVTLPLGVAIYIFEVGLVATLQAFIFATLAAIYLGEAASEGH